VTSENLQCGDNGRRERIRAANSGAIRWNGIDYIEAIGTEPISQVRVTLLCDLAYEYELLQEHGNSPLNLANCVIVKDESDRPIPVSYAV
jgi:hypothetical protein